MKTFADDATMQRFWAMVEVTPTCWLWQGALKDGGYGAFQNFRAHKFILEVTRGYSVVPGYDVSHICNVRACVNPEHLCIETRRENLSRAKGTKRQKIRVLWHPSTLKPKRAALR